MSFRINTNIAAMNAHTNGVANNRSLSGSLEKLSSGLRINKAADDASGMAIADSLRSQASALGQAVSNANDAIGIIQIADKAMDEQLKILDTIKVKATQAAQDGQTAKSREALQKDIRRLMENLDNIAETTTFNGQQLLNGSFTNKEFQVGAYSNQTVNATIDATESNKIGNIRIETFTLSGTVGGSHAMNTFDADGVVAGASGQLSFFANGEMMDLEVAVISTSAGTGVGQMASVINKNSADTGVRAAWTNEYAFDIASGAVNGLNINGVAIGSVANIKTDDRTGVLVDAINSQKEKTGVEASTDREGNLVLRSMDGRGFTISAAAGSNALRVADGSGGTEAFDVSTKIASFGNITLTRLDSSDIIVSGGGTLGLNFASMGNASANLNLGDTVGTFDANIRSAAGANSHTIQREKAQDMGTGVQTLRGAMLVMDLAESATRKLGEIRADFGSVQNQLVSTINNISVTQVNVKAAESQIRDVDFAAESSTFQKHNILAQSGSYAMSQANAVQQNVMQLLQ